MKKEERTKIVGGVTGKGFDVLGQPTPEQKKKGWEKKREGKKILDLMKELGDMNYYDFKKLVKDISKNPKEHTLREAKMVQYMTKEKFLTDYLDRNIGKPTQAVGFTTDGENLEKLNITIVDPDGKYGLTSDDSVTIKN